MLHISIVLICLMPSSCPGKHWRLRSDENEQHFRVKHVFLHPLYVPSTFQNDVALVELLESPKLNNFVMPICLPEGPTEEGTLPHPCSQLSEQFRLLQKLSRITELLVPADGICVTPQLALLCNL